MKAEQQDTGDVRTWGDIVERFTAYYANRSAGSRNNLAKAVQTIDKALPESTPISKLTPLKLIEVRDAIATSTSKLSTRKLRMTYLKMVFRWAAKHPGIPLESNPAANLEPFRARGTRGKGMIYTAVGKDEVLNLAEAERMIAYAHKNRAPVMAYMLETALATGMRKGELCGLKWAYVDFDTRTIRVCRNYDRKGTKSGEERTVPMTEELVNSLR